MIHPERLHLLEPSPPAPKFRPSSQTAMTNSNRIPLQRQTASIPARISTQSLLSLHWSANWPLLLRLAVQKELSKHGHPTSSWPSLVPTEMLEALKSLAGKMSVDACADVVVREFVGRIGRSGMGDVGVQDLRGGLELWEWEMAEKEKEWERKTREMDAETRLYVRGLKREESLGMTGGLNTPLETPEPEDNSSFLTTEDHPFSRKLLAPIAPMYRTQQPTPPPQTPILESTPISAPRVKTEVLLKCTKVFPPYNRIHPERASYRTVSKFESKKISKIKTTSSRNVFLPRDTLAPKRRPRPTPSTYPTLDAIITSAKPSSSPKKLKYCKKCEAPQSFFCHSHSRNSKRINNRGLRLLN